MPSAPGTVPCDGHWLAVVCSSLSLGLCAPASLMEIDLRDEFSLVSTVCEVFLFHFN